MWGKGGGPDEGGGYGNKTGITFVEKQGAGKRVSQENKGCLDRGVGAGKELHKSQKDLQAREGGEATVVNGKGPRKGTIPYRLIGEGRKKGKRVGEGEKIQTKMLVEGKG